MRITVSRALLAASASLGWGTVRAQEMPVSVTTDTWEYCSQLQMRIKQQPEHPAAVKQLVQEGRRRCDHGDVRGGISRLRQALVMMKHPPEAP